MIPKTLSEITRQDLQALIDAGRIEDQRIEYKRSFPEAGDDRTALFKPMCAFANTEGGDLLIGMEAVDGVPTALLGLDVTNRDAMTLSITSAIGDGTEPAVRGVHCHYVEVDAGRTVIVIRVEKSWSRPHRMKRGGVFYGRGAANNYALDLPAIKRALLFTEATAEQARAFQADRISALLERTGPVKLNANATLLMHLAPVSALGQTEWQITPEQWKARKLEFQPPSLHPSAVSWEYHADGFVARESSDSEGSAGYSLLFRSGILELAFWIGRIHREGKIVPAGALESLLVRSLKQFLPLMQSLGLSTPILMSFALLEAEKHILAYENDWSDGAMRPFDRKIYIFPWTTITDVTEDPSMIVRPSLDALWNAAGHERSINFTQRARDRGTDV